MWNMKVKCWTRYWWKTSASFFASNTFIGQNLIDWVINCVSWKRTFLYKQKNTCRDTYSLSYKSSRWWRLETPTSYWLYLAYVHFPSVCTTGSVNRHSLVLYSSLQTSKFNHFRLNYSVNTIWSANFNVFIVSLCK